MDSLGGTKGTPGRQEGSIWTSTREAPGRQGRTNRTAWAAPGRHQGGRKGRIGQPAKQQGGTRWAGKDYLNSLQGTTPSRPSTASGLCRTAITTIHRPLLFPTGPPPRPSTSSVPCRTSTTTIHAPSVRCRTSAALIPAQCFCRTPTPPTPKPSQIECQQLCQLDCPVPCEMVRPLCTTAMVQGLGLVSDARQSRDQSLRQKWTQQAVLPVFCCYPSVFSAVWVLSFYASFRQTCVNKRFCNVMVGITRRTVILRCGSSVWG